MEVLWEVGAEMLPNLLMYLPLEGNWDGPDGYSLRAERAIELSP